MEINLEYTSLPIFSALDSETRIDILRAIAKQPLSVSELADNLHYSKAVISKHISILEHANLLQQVQTDNTDKRKKILHLKTDNISITFPEKIYPELRKQTYDLPLGNYFNTENIQPTCGIASKDRLIGKFDDPNVFLSQKRFQAQLIWFSAGYVEYIIPNDAKNIGAPELIEVSLEISSEFPQSNNTWPSDISFWINDTKVGTYTVRGNFSDVRGTLTPSWWSSSYSQYGQLKHLRVLKTDTAMDGESISSVTLKDLHIQDSSTIHLRIGIDPTSPPPRWINRFWELFWKLSTKY